MLASVLLAPPTDPKKDRIEFEKYLLSNGLITHVGSGLYCYSPLLKVMIRNIERLVEKFMERDLGALPVELTTIQDVEYFKRSGRFDTFRDEVFTFEDRRQRSYILSPTNEEVITEMFETKFLQNFSTRVTFYQIDKKFRDELGGGSISRTREFRMAELYSFHSSAEDLQAFSRSVIRVLSSFLNSLGCEFTVNDSKESVTTRLTGTLSLDFQAISSLNTGFVDENGSNLLQLAKWSPLGNTYLSNKSFSMSCLGLGPIRILLHLFEGLSGGTFMKSRPVAWPTIIQPYDTAVLLPDQNSKYASHSSHLYELVEHHPNLLFDDRRSPGFSQRRCQLTSLGVRNLIELSGREEKPLQLTTSDGNTQFLSLIEGKEFLALNMTASHQTVMSTDGSRNQPEECKHMLCN